MAREAVSLAEALNAGEKDVLNVNALSDIVAGLAKSLAGAFSEVLNVSEK